MTIIHQWFAICYFLLSTACFTETAPTGGPVDVLNVTTSDVRDPTSGWNSLADKGSLTSTTTPSLPSGSGFNSSAGEAPLLEDAVQPYSVCGGSLTASTSSQPLTSPGYPSNYPSNQYCTWTITASSGYYIAIQVVSLSTESSYDYLIISQVNTGGGTTQLARLSGSTTGTYYTTTNSAQIVFSSDSTNNYAGWSLYYYATQLSCGGSLSVYSYSQTLYSPGYPSSYPNNAYCAWTLTAGAGYRITMQVYSMNTELSTDYLYLYQVNTYSSNTLLAQLSGSTTGTYTTTTNSAQIVFTSDSSVTYSGWQLYYYTTTAAATAPPVPSYEGDTGGGGWGIYIGGGVGGGGGGLIFLIILICCLKSYCC